MRRFYFFFLQHLKKLTLRILSRTTDVVLWFYRLLFSYQNWVNFQYSLKKSFFIKVCPCPCRVDMEWRSKTQIYKTGNWHKIICSLIEQERKNWTLTPSIVKGISNTYRWKKKNEKITLVFTYFVAYGLH